MLSRRQKGREVMRMDMYADGWWELMLGCVGARDPPMTNTELREG